MAGVAAAALSACATEVLVDAASEAPLEARETWAWRPHPVAYESWRVGDPELEESMRETVARELAALGYRQTGAGAPDFTLTVYAEIGSEVEVSTAPTQQTIWSNQMSSSYNISGDVTRTRVYETGHLLVEVADPAGQILWRGAASRRVRGNFDEEAGSILASILQRLPARQPRD